MSEKTHYRKVFKSDHLGVADLEEMIEEGKPLTFNIQVVKQEYSVMVAGRTGNHNIAYFKEAIKPLVINSINSKVIKSFANNSPFVEDWGGIKVELYIDPNVKMKGEIVGGVRIKSKPAITLKDLEAMFKEKEILIPPSELEQVESVIDNKDKSKYLRVYSYLSKLKVQ